jgi:hypothetical protein
MTDEDAFHEARQRWGIKAPCSIGRRIRNMAKSPMRPGSATFCSSCTGKAIRGKKRSRTPNEEDSAQKSRGRKRGGAQRGQREFPKIRAGRHGGGLVPAPGADGRFLSANVPKRRLKSLNSISPARITETLRWPEWLRNWPTTCGPTQESSQVGEGQACAGCGKLLRSQGRRTSRSSSTGQQDQG